MSYTLGTNTTGYSYPGYTYWRKGVQTQYDRKLWSVARDNLILDAFTGPEGSGKPFITKSELKKKKGDTIRLGMRGVLSGVGKLGKVTMEGSEENIVQYFVDVYVNQLRNAVIDDGELSRQRDLYDLNMLFPEVLGEWLATQVEKYLFNCIEGGWAPHIIAPNITYEGLAINSSVVRPNKNWFIANSAAHPITYSATDATWLTNIQAGEQSVDSMTSDKSLWFGSALLEGVASKMKVLNIKPAKYEGWTGWIGFIHPYQTAQLRADAAWFEANVHAMPQGTDGNPIFTGKLANMAVGMWNSIALFESNLVHSGNESTYTDAWGGTLEIDSGCDNVRRAIFCGAEAVAIAEAKAPHIERKGDFDYNNYEGQAVSTIMGMGRADFVSDTSTATIINQGSLIVSTVSPATSI